MKHYVCKMPLATRVLGFINISPILLGNSAPNDCTVPTGTEPLPRGCATKVVSDVARRLNEYHLQIDCILLESGFLDLQQTGLKWNLNFCGKSFSDVLHAYISFIIEDTEGHDGLCGHFKSRTAKVAQLCRACECPTFFLDTQRPAVSPIANPTSSTSCLGTRTFLHAMSQQYL